jgi:hypothetical protein
MMVYDIPAKQLNFLMIDNQLNIILESFAQKKGRKPINCKKICTSLLRDNQSSHSKCFITYNK